jgi:hypothetical protein
MTETLDQQLDFQPEENQVLDFLVENYGHKLEKLTRQDKFLMISILATHLRSDKNHHPDLLKIIYECSTLSRMDIEQLIEAISNQIVTGCYAETHNNTGK